MREAILLLFVMATVGADSTQDPLRPIVVGSEERELKRTAYRLRIPAEQLRNARRALEEATEVAGRLDPLPASQVSSLGRLWLFTHRSVALPRLESLLAKLRSSAEQSTQAAVYHSATTAGWSLLWTVAHLDPDRALDILRRWPKPPPGQSEIPAGQQLESRMRENAILPLLSGNPQAVAALLEDFGGARSFSGRLRAQLAAQLHLRGQKEKALSLVDSVASELTGRLPGAQVSSDHQEFLRILARFDQERALAAFHAIGRVDGIVTGRQTALRADDQDITLTPGESAQLEALRSLRRHPEFALRALASAPNLSAKVAASGGLDRVLAPVSSGLPPAGVRIYNGGWSAGTVIGSARLDPTLVADLHEKSAKEPSYVRRKLSEKAHDVGALLELAQSVASQDPDLSLLAVERAGELVPGVQPAESRADSLRMLLAVSRQLGFERDRSLFELGFVLLDELMEAGPEPPPRPRIDAAPSAEEMRAARTYHAAETLETALVTEYAWADFEAALRFTRALTDPRRFRCLLRIAQAISDPPSGTPWQASVRASQTDPPQRELRRTADHLRIPVERLRNARAALAAGTELALNMELMQTSALWTLASEWIRLDPRRARERIESMYRALRLAAETCADAKTYTRLTSSVQMLLVRLANLDAERAADLARAWPSPSPALDDPAFAARKSLENGFREQTLQKFPATAVSPEPLTPDGRPSYSARARAAEQWMASGRNEEANRLISESIADFEKRSLDPQLVNDYTTLIQTLLPREPDLALRAVEVLAPVARTAPGDPGFAGEIQMGDSRVAITGFEASLLKVLDSIYGQPELTARMFALFPDLKAKLASVGGLDNLLDPGEGAGSWISVKYDGGRNSWGIGRPPFAEQALAAELRGKALSKPALVRDRMREEFAATDRLVALIEFARRTSSSSEDPELASIALDVARGLVRRTPLEQRGSALGRLAECWREIEGSVDPDLIREGFALVNQLKSPSAGPAESSSAKTSTGFSAQSLEDLLLALLARDDFETAARQILVLSGSARQLSAWLGVIRELGQIH